MPRSDHRADMYQCIVCKPTEAKPATSAGQRTSIRTTLIGGSGGRGIDSQLLRLTSTSRDHTFCVQGTEVQQRA
eukprot:scaffold601983_cov15-Prasinocladus_malaysianus.AAC.1